MRGPLFKQTIKLLQKKKGKEMKTLATFNKRNVIALFATIVFSLTLHGVSHAAATFTHIHVDAVNGTNGPGRGSAAKPYKSITYALLISERSDLPDPWHVHIHPGTYDADPAKPANAREIFPLKLRQEMIFEGTTTAAECIIDGQHTGAVIVPILVGEDTERVTIRNLTVQNSLRTNGVGGIVLHDPTGTKETPSIFEGCIIHNNKGGGVGTNMPLILTGNTFSNNHGAGVGTSKSIAATNNTFSANHSTGLYIDGSSAGDISGNIFQNNVRSGLQINSTLEGNLIGNTFTGNTNGSGARIETFTGNITDNKFISNRHLGGLSIGTLTGDIVNNEFARNTGSWGDSGGLIVWTLTGNITDNVFTNNPFGASIRQSITGNITGNKFIGNNDNRGLWIGTLTGNITNNEFTRNKHERGIGGGFLLRRSPVTFPTIFLIAIQPSRVGHLS